MPTVNRVQRSFLSQLGVTHPPGSASEIRERMRRDRDYFRLPDETRSAVVMAATPRSAEGAGTSAADGGAGTSGADHKGTGSRSKNSRGPKGTGGGSEHPAKGKKDDVPSENSYENIVGSLEFLTSDEKEEMRAKWQGQSERGSRRPAPPSLTGCSAVDESGGERTSKDGKGPHTNARRKPSKKHAIINDPVAASIAKLASRSKGSLVRPADVWARPAGELVRTASKTGRRITDDVEDDNERTPSNQGKKERKEGGGEDRIKQQQVANDRENDRIETLPNQGKKEREEGGGTMLKPIKQEDEETKPTAESGNQSLGRDWMEGATKKDDEPTQKGTTENFSGRRVRKNTQRFIARPSRRGVGVAEGDAAFLASTLGVGVAEGDAAFLASTLDLRKNVVIGAKAKTKCERKRGEPAKMKRGRGRPRRADAVDILSETDEPAVQLGMSQRKSDESGAIPDRERKSTRKANGKVSKTEEPSVEFKSDTSGSIKKPPKRPASKKRGRGRPRKVDMGATDASGPVSKNEGKHAAVHPGGGPGPDEADIFSKANEPAIESGKSRPKSDKSGGGAAPDRKNKPPRKANAKSPLLNSDQSKVEDVPQKRPASKKRGPGRPRKTDTGATNAVAPVSKNEGKHAAVNSGGGPGSDEADIFSKTDEPAIESGKSRPKSDESGGAAAAPDRKKKPPRKADAKSPPSNSNQSRVEDVPQKRLALKKRGPGRPRKTDMGATDAGAPVSNNENGPAAVDPGGGPGPTKDGGAAPAVRRRKPPKPPRRPLLKVGAAVHAAYWPPEDAARRSEPSWYPGVVSSYKISNFPADKRYGYVRYYDVRYDDGDFLDRIPDHFVFASEEYLLHQIYSANENHSLMGGVRNVTDESSEDLWARHVGWFVAVVDGRERAFSQLRNALRACEASLGENYSPIKSGVASTGKECAPGDLSEDEDRPILLASNDGVVPKEWDTTPLVDCDVPATMTDDSCKRKRLANDAFEGSGGGDVPTKHSTMPTSVGDCEKKSIESRTKGVYALANGKWKVQIGYKSDRLCLQQFTREQAWLVNRVARQKLDETKHLKLGPHEIKRNIRLAEEAVRKALSEFKGESNSDTPREEVARNSCGEASSKDNEDKTLPSGDGSATAMASGSKKRAKNSSSGEDAAPAKRAKNSSGVEGVFALATGKYRVQIGYNARYLVFKSCTWEQAVLLNRVAREKLDATRNLKLSPEEIGSNLKLAKEAALGALSELDDDAAPARAPDASSSDERSARKRSRPEREDGRPSKKTLSMPHSKTNADVDYRTLGVWQRHEKWRVNIIHGGKLHCLGRYATQDHAALAKEIARNMLGKCRYRSSSLTDEQIRRNIAEAKKAASKAIFCSGGSAANTSARIDEGQKIDFGTVGLIEQPYEQWGVNVRYGGEVHYLGTFLTRDHAALARMIARKQQNVEVAKEAVWKAIYDNAEFAEKSSEDAQLDRLLFKESMRLEAEVDQTELHLTRACCRSNTAFESWLRYKKNLWKKHHQGKRNRDVASKDATGNYAVCEHGETTKMSSEEAKYDKLLKEESMRWEAEADETRVKLVRGRFQSNMAFESWIRHKKDSWRKHYQRKHNEDLASKGDISIDEEKGQSKGRIADFGADGDICMLVEDPLAQLHEDFLPRVLENSTPKESDRTCNPAPNKSPPPPAADGADQKGRSGVGSSSLTEIPKKPTQLIPPEMLPINEEFGPKTPKDIALVKEAAEHCGDTFRSALLAQFLAVQSVVAPPEQSTLKRKYSAKHPSVVPQGGEQLCTRINKTSDVLTEAVQVQSKKGNTYLAYRAGVIAAISHGKKCTGFTIKKGTQDAMHARGEELNDYYYNATLKRMVENNDLIHENSTYRLSDSLLEQLSKRHVEQPGQVRIGLDAEEHCEIELLEHRQGKAVAHSEDMNSRADNNHLNLPNPAEHTLKTAIKPVDEGLRMAKLRGRPRNEDDADGLRPIKWSEQPQQPMIAALMEDLASGGNADGLHLPKPEESIAPDLRKLCSESYGLHSPNPEERFDGFDWSKQDASIAPVLHRGLRSPKPEEPVASDLQRFCSENVDLCSSRPSEHRPPTKAARSRSKFARDEKQKKYRGGEETIRKAIHDNGESAEMPAEEPIASDLRIFCKENADLCRSIRMVHWPAAARRQSKPDREKKQQNDITAIEAAWKATSSNGESTEISADDAQLNRLFNEESTSLEDTVGQDELELLRRPSRPVMEDPSAFDLQRFCSENSDLLSAERYTKVAFFVTKPSKDCAFGIAVQQENSGVKVVSIAPNSLFIGTSLREGMVLVTVNGQECPTVASAVALFSAAENLVLIVAAVPDTRSTSRLLGNSTISPISTAVALANKVPIPCPPLVGQANSKDR